MPLMGFPHSDREPQREFALVLSSRPYAGAWLARLLLGLGVPSIEQPATPESLQLIDEVDPSLILLVVDASDSRSVSYASAVSETAAGDVAVVLDSRDPAHEAQMLRAGADVTVREYEDVDAALAVLQALRRKRVSRLGLETRASLIEVGDLVVDAARYQVKAGTQVVPLTVTEFQILGDFARNADAVLSQREVIERATGRPYSDVEAKDALKVYVRRLRLKLGEAGIPVSALVNVRGFGYMLQSAECRVPRPPNGLSIPQRTAVGDWTPS